MLPWEKVLQLLVINRMIDPESEFRLHRQWFDRSAMDDLLGYDFVMAEKDRLYRCLDRVLEHKEAPFLYLKKRWKTLFNARFDVLLYDLTSTYFEGQAEQNPKAKRGYSRDGRPDCLLSGQFEYSIGCNLVDDSVRSLWTPLCLNNADRFF